jgi:hypothetical protein
MRVTIAVPFLLPLYSLPSPPPDLILNSTAATLGAVSSPESTPSLPLSVLTPINAVIPEDILGLYGQLREGVRRQMTFKLLLSQIDLLPRATHLMYVSALLMEFRLTKLWEVGEMYCLPCPACGNVVYGNALVAGCGGCDDPRGRVVELRLNPAMLARVADETGALRSEHAVLVADGAWDVLLGGLRIEKGRRGMEAWEERVVFRRFTFVFLWVGEWMGGRLVLVDLVD